MTKDQAIQILLHKYGARVVQDPKAHKSRRLYFEVPRDLEDIGEDLMEARETLGVDDMPIMYVGAKPPDFL